MGAIGLPDALPTEVAPTVTQTPCPSFDGQGAPYSLFMLYFASSGSIMIDSLLPVFRNSAMNAEIVCGVCASTSCL